MSMRRTLLGLDKGANAGLKRHLRDESLAAIERVKALNASQLARLKTVDAVALTDLDRVNGGIVDTGIHHLRWSREATEF